MTVVSELEPEYFPKEATQIIFEGKTQQAIQELADTQLKKLSVKEYEGKQNEVIRWMPRRDQSWDEYLIHLLQGDAPP